VHVRFVECVSLSRLSEITEPRRASRNGEILLCPDAWIRATRSPGLFHDNRNANRKKERHKICRDRARVRRCARSLGRSRARARCEARLGLRIDSTRHGIMGRLCPVETIPLLADDARASASRRIRPNLPAAHVIRASDLPFANELNGTGIA